MLGQDILMVKYAGKYGKRKGVYRPLVSETNRKQNYQQHYHDADDELIDMTISFAICTTVFTLANRNVFVGIYAEEEEEEEEKEYKN
uniref:Uncharacterized protein n=1 Tax=Glossina morsitans morsitans TaxID=37546 RepID=A0A1B0G2I5_GLOMM